MKQALLIIDAQQELIDGNEQENEVFRKTELLSTLNIALQKAIDSNALIVFVRDIDVASVVAKDLKYIIKFKYPSLQSLLIKQRTNSFYGTSLLELLKEENINHIVIGGCKTEHCIDTAVRTATVQGFDVTLIKTGIQQLILTYCLQSKLLVITIKLYTVIITLIIFYGERYRGRPLSADS